jgi:hypothetical protein
MFSRIAPDAVLDFTTWMSESLQMAQLISPPLNPGGGPTTPVCIRLADADMNRLHELIEGMGLLNQSQAARLAISEGLDRLERKRRARSRPLAGG